MLQLLGCASSDPASSRAPGGANLQGLLAGTWVDSVVLQPESLDSLLGEEGGEGWLHLYRGDLEAASKAFAGVDTPAGRLGQARVHLVRADSFRTAALLQTQAAAEVSSYRREHRATVRRSPLEDILDLRVGQLSGADAAGLTAVEQAIPSEVAKTALGASLLALARQEGSVPEGLPEPLASRLGFARALDAGDLDGARALLGALGAGTPDLVLPLGSDQEAGLSFELRYFDGVLLRALARYHLASAWELASAESGPGALVASAVRQAWGSDLPEGLQQRPTSPNSVPEWAVLFAAPALDSSDWEAYWASAESPLLARADQSVPGLQLRSAQRAEGIDATLRELEASRDPIASFLRERGGEEGAPLVTELDLPSLVLDRLLRARVDGLVASGGAVQATRLGHRATDPRPSADSGPADAARTRVCYRNDRAWLLRYAGSLWRAGQPGAALDIIHPLVEEEPALQSLKEALGQIDAAASIGSQGKASQR